MNNEEKALHSGLVKLLDEATFPLRKKETRSFGVVMQWVDMLPQNLEAQAKRIKELDSKLAMVDAKAKIAKKKTTRKKVKSGA